VIRTMADAAATELSILILYAYTAVYLVIGGALFVARRDEVRQIFGRTAANARSAMSGRSESVDHAD